MLSTSHPFVTSCGVVGLGLVHNLGDITNLYTAHEQNLSPAVQGPLPKTDVSKLSEFLPKAPMRRILHYARMGLLAASQALKSLPDDVSREDVGLVIGSAYAGAKMSMDFMDSILDGSPRLSSPTAFSHAVNNMGAGLLSLYLGLRGPCHTISQDSLSFAGGLEIAITMLLAKRARYVLLGAIEETDSRLLNTDKNVFQHKNLDDGEGAVFFLLTKRNNTTISLQWNKAEIFSDSLEENGIYKNIYGFTPLAQAFDTAMQFFMLSEGQKAKNTCCQSVYGRQATITLQA